MDSARGRGSCPSFPKICFSWCILFYFCNAWVCVCICLCVFRCVCVLGVCACVFSGECVHVCWVVWCVSECVWVCRCVRECVLSMTEYEYLICVFWHHWRPCELQGSRMKPEHQHRAVCERYKKWISSVVKACRGFTHTKSIVCLYVCVWAKNKANHLKYLLLV